MVMACAIIVEVVRRIADSAPPGLRRHSGASAPARSTAHALPRRSIQGYGHAVGGELRTRLRGVHGLDAVDGLPDLADALRQCAVDGTAPLVAKETGMERARPVRIGDRPARTEFLLY